MVVPAGLDSEAEMLTETGDKELEHKHRLVSSRLVDPANFPSQSNV